MIPRSPLTLTEYVVLASKAGQQLNELSKAAFAMAIALAACAIPLQAADKSLRRPQDKPNIIFIMADDLGWFDVGYNGAPFYETPNIDQLAADGMIFDRSYTGGPNCAPTRACLISGMYTPRHRVYTPGGKAKGGTECFKRMRWLVPNVINREGNGEFPSANDSLSEDTISLAEVLKPSGYKTAMLGKWHLNPKRKQGFDLFSCDGVEFSKFGRKYGSVNVAETLTDCAVRFIRDNKDGPFFLYLSHWDVHKPFKAKGEVVKRYDKKLQSKEWGHEWNTTYAAMIEAFDTSVGRVRAEVTRLGLEKNTLIIVTSDNGGVSGVLSGPLKGNKGSFFEGGVRVATAMSWPGVIKAGSRCSVPTTSVDYMPTFAELAGGTLPTTQPVDGKSLVPLIKGEEALTDRSIFWHFPLYLPGNVIPVYGTDTLYWRAVPSSMIVKGQWKLIQFYESDTIQLYNIAEDISEKQDLAKSQPEKAKALLKELQQWVSKTGAPVPKTPNKSFTKDGEIMNKGDKRATKKKRK
jgi:arylsulfatase A-like enzyme